MPFDIVEGLDHHCFSNYYLIEHRPDDLGKKRQTKSVMEEEERFSKSHHDSHCIIPHASSSLKAYSPRAVKQPIRVLLLV